MYPRISEIQLPTLGDHLRFLYTCDFNGVKHTRTLLISHIELLKATSNLDEINYQRMRVLTKLYADIMLYERRRQENADVDEVEG